MAQDVEQLVTEAEVTPSQPQATTEPLIPRPSLVARFASGLPGVLIVIALAGLAYWGHRTEWTIPKASELVSAPVEPEDWCNEHNVPESECVECNVEKWPMPSSYGWCKEHGIHECSLHHPDVAQLKQVPEVGDDHFERASKALEFAVRIENNSQCKLHRRRIQFVSAEAAERAGIDIGLVTEAPIAELIRANGEISYDQTALVDLASRLPGSVWRVEKQVGELVRKGEVLALIEASEVGKAKAELLQAIADLDLQEQTLKRRQATKGSLAGAQILETEAAVREAKIRVLSAQQSLINLGLPVDSTELKGLSEDELVQRIQFLGLPETLVHSLDHATTTGNLLPIRSPLDGVIVSRSIVAGEVVDSAKTLLTVTDINRMWLRLDVRLEDAANLALRQAVRFIPDGGSQEASGTVSWISTEVDEQTRTVEVRVEIANEDGQLRANTFGTGEIVLREEPNAIVVPSEGVHWEGCCHVVFVRDKHYLEQDAPKVFHVRKVRPAAIQNGLTELVAGVLPGEVIAVKGSALLRAELLKNNLGAG